MGSCFPLASAGKAIGTAGGGNTGPGIPIHGGGDRLGRGFDGQALRPDGSIGPGMHFADVADGSVPDHFGALAGAFVRISLIAHLRGDLIFRGEVGEQARFPNGARERLLTIDVLAALHRPGGADGVHEIRRGDDDGVDVLFLIEHLAEVGIPGRLVELVEHFLGAVGVGIAEGDDIFLGVVADGDAATRLASRADGGDVQFFIRRFEAEHLEIRRAAESRGGDCAGEQGSKEKVSSIESVVCHSVRGRGPSPKGEV